MNSFFVIKIPQSFSRGFLISTLLILFFLQSCAIKTREQGIRKLESTYRDAFQNMQFSKSSTLLLHSDTEGIHLKYSGGFLNQDGKFLSTDPDQPFHVASIGKLFTMTLVLQMVVEKKISLTDPIEKYLGKEILSSLFVVKGKDYSSEVTVLQLLNHTSGVADYFDHRDNGEPGLLEDIRKNKDKFWSPQEILEFVRTKSPALAPPGKKFYYSDTGYILLGLLIEKIAGKKFESVLQDKILLPLGMKNTYMHLRSEPIEKTKKGLSPMMLGKYDVTDYRSISVDWAGGGLVSNTEDLLTFHKALIEGKLFSKDTYPTLRGRNTFMKGIKYGTGVMTVNYGDIFFLMKGTPELHGHSGLLSTHLFYCPDYDLHIIANFGSTDDISKSFEMIYFILSTVKEIQSLQKK